MKLSLLPTLLVVGCGDNRAPMLPDASILEDGPQTRTITLSAQQRFVTANGDVVVPYDLTGEPISVLVPPTFTEILGSGDAQGMASIAGVPDGTFYLDVGVNYEVTSRSSIDLSDTRLGRATVEPATPGTLITFNVSGLSPWQDGDELQLFAPNSGLIAFNMQRASATAPLLGATSLSGFQYDLYRAAYRALVDAAAGDVVTLAQLAIKYVGATPFRTIAERFTAPPFTIAAGGRSTLTGAFSSIAQDQTLAVSWDRQEFDRALRSATPTEGTYSYPLLALQALPDAATRGFYHPAPDIAAYEPGYVADTSLLTTTGLTYGDPFPSTWTRIVTVRYYVYRFIALGNAQPLAAFGYLDDDRKLSAVANTTITPSLGPILSPTVNGLDAYTNQTGVGTQPKLAWTPPSIGAPSRYIVIVSRVYDNAGRTAEQLLASVQTSEPNVVMPPDILQPGNSYMFRIVAETMPSLDLDATPNALALPSATSLVTTALVTP